MSQSFVKPIDVLYSQLTFPKNNFQKVVGTDIAELLLKNRNENVSVRPASVLSNISSTTGDIQAVSEASLPQVSEGGNFSSMSSLKEEEITNKFREYLLYGSEQEALGQFISILVDVIKLKKGWNDLVSKCSQICKEVFERVKNFKENGKKQFIELKFFILQNYIQDDIYFFRMGDETWLMGPRPLPGQQAGQENPFKRDGQVCQWVDHERSSSNAIPATVWKNSFSCQRKFQIKA